MTESGDYSDGTGRILAEPDRKVWVVEENTGSGWSVSAVLTSYEDAEQYEEDLREFTRNHNQNIPDDFEIKIETRHGGRRSPTKMFEEWPPQSLQSDTHRSGGEDD